MDITDALRANVTLMVNSPQDVIVECLAIERGASYTFTTHQVEAADFDALTPLVTQVPRDFHGLTRKKQDGPVSATRISMINRLFERTKSTLKLKPSWSLLDLIDPDMIPQNADAMLILGQYVDALSSVRDSIQRRDMVAHVRGAQNREPNRMTLEKLGHSVVFAISGRVSRQWRFPTQ
jgi:hypothetical protein